VFPRSCHPRREKKWHLYSCFDQWSLPSELGCTGINIVHLSFDRGCFEPLGRLIQQSQNYDHAASAACGEGAAHEQYLTSWIVRNADPLHDAANSYAWALHPHEETDTYKDLWVIISSIRNAYGQILEHLGPWLAKNIKWQPHGMYDHNVLTQLWRCLGVDPDFIPITKLIAISAALPAIVGSTPRLQRHSGLSHLQAFRTLYFGRLFMCPPL
jgi:hypothetical protein